MSYAINNNSKQFMCEDVNRFPSLKNIITEVDERAKIAQSVINSLSQGNSKEWEERLYRSSMATAYHGSISGIAAAVFTIFGALAKDDVALGLGAGFTLSLLLEVLFHNPKRVIKDYENHEEIMNALQWPQINKALREENFAEFRLKLSLLKNKFLTSDHKKESDTILKAGALATLLKTEATRKELKLACKQLIKGGIPTAEINSFKEEFLRKVATAKQDSEVEVSEREEVESSFDRVLEEPPVRVEVIDPDLVDNENPVDSE